MTDINETFERMIAEMQRYGATPAPSKGGSYNDLLRYREAREKILERFLDAFAEGYRLGKEDTEAEPLTCTGCCYLDEQCVPCAHCIRAAGYADYYRRPPERQEDNNETD